MKVAVLNYTGTVGKTTIAAHLLAPRLNDAQVFAVESINETAESLGVDVEQIKGQRFRELFKKLVMLDEAIVDVGASNIEAFLDGMLKFEDSHTELDYYLVPVTSGNKEQKETIAVLNTLANLGIPADKIRVVFNRVESDVEDEFRPLLNFLSKQPLAVANKEAAIFENELFDMLSFRRLTINELLNDPEDYRAKARETAKTDPKASAEYTDRHVMKSLAKSVNRNLDDVFLALFN